MGNINLKPSSMPSTIPGQRVSQEAQKAQKREALIDSIKTARTQGEGAVAGVVQNAINEHAKKNASGAVMGGLLGGLAGVVLALPNNKSYTIQAGDNLTSIAKSQLGDKVSGNDLEKYMEKILDLNEDVIKNPHMLYKGDTIALPAAPAQGQANNVQKFLD